MTRIIALALLSISAFAQTAVFPGAVVTDAQLGVASNVTKAQLTGSCGATDTTCYVTNSSCIKAGYSVACNVAFTANMFLVTDNEAVAVCGVTMGSVTTALQFGKSSCPNIDGRGFDGTTASRHNASLIQAISIAWNHNATNKEVEAIETNLSVATTFAQIQALYAAFPATGGAIALASDISITTASTISISGGKALVLDPKGHSFNCSNTSGACLTFTHASGAATNVAILPGLITYVGASTGVTGLRFLNFADSTTVQGLKISGFSTANSYCMTFDNAENVSVISGNQCQGNFNGLKATNFSTNLLFQALRIENGDGGGGAGAVPIRIEQQSTGLTFDHVLVQTTNTKRAVEIDSTVGGAITELRFKNCWFENIGDTTANSRVFWVSANASHNILNFSAESNIYNADAQGALGTVYEFTGDGSAVTSNPHFFGNSYGGYSHIITGTAAFPILTVGDNFEFCDVCVNKAGVSGVTWFPQTAGHEYRMWAGDGAQLGDGNNWTFKDNTAGINVLHYTSNTQILTLPQTTQKTPIPVGSLPACAAGTAGASAGVTDSNAASFAAGIGAVVAAGGTTKVPVYCDGTNWRIG